MLDMLLLDIFQNLDISQYCHVTTSFIFDSQPSLSVDFNTELSHIRWVSIVCKLVNIGVWLLLSLAADEWAWLDRLAWWWWRIWRLQTTPRLASPSLHLLADQWGGSVRSCEALLSWQVSNSWLAGVSPHDLSQCQTGLSVVSALPPPPPPPPPPPSYIKHQTS